MVQWRPDPTFYPSPRMAAKAPAETLAYVATFDPERRKPDASPSSISIPRASRYSQDRRHRGHAECRRRAASFRLERLLLLPLPQRAASAHRAALSGGAGPALVAHPHPRHQARSAKNPKIVKVIEPEEIAEKAGYTRPHTIHCGPEGIYVAALGNAEGKAPGGIFLMDHETFERARPLGDRPRAAAARL